MGIDSVGMLNDAALDAALEATLHRAGDPRWLHQGKSRSYLAEHQNQEAASTQQFEHDIAILGALRAGVNEVEARSAVFKDISREAAKAGKELKKCNP